jgi:L-malate glycosyltransferase
LFPTGIMALYLKKFERIPYIISEHWTGYLSSKKNTQNGFQKFASKIIAKNASCIVPVSKDLRDAMLQLKLNAPYEIIYNVVDMNLFFPRTTGKNEKIKFLHISTLDDAHKNISGMLRATAQLAKLRSDFEIWFIGDGDTTPHIHTATELKMYNTFAFFDGTKTTVEVASIMRHADCFLLFSNYENLPCVMLESLASGIPIVSSSVGGIPEHLTDELGMLVKPLDEKGLLDALNKTIDKIKAGDYKATVLSNYAHEHFSYEKVSMKFHDLYQRILAKK